MPPFRLLFLAAFIAVPLAEIALLIQIGGAIGVLATIAIVIGTAVLGTSLLHRQGFGVLARATEAIEAGKMPVEPVIEGVFLLVAGAFLLTPGLLTDAFGFAMLIPPIRQAIASWTLKTLVKSGKVHVSVFSDVEEDVGAGPPPHRPRGFDPDVIDGEYERVDERTINPDRRGSSRDGRDDHRQ